MNPSPERIVGQGDDKSSINSELLGKVNLDSIRYFLERVYGERNHLSEAAISHANHVKAFILSNFSNYGFQTTVQPIKSVDGYTNQNIIGRLMSGQDSVLLIGAHFDTVLGSPGADDNGSGIAALLECARVLAQYTFNKSILFVAFDMEEQKMEGSHFFLKTYAERNKIVGFINMDMIGYTSDKPGSQIVPKVFDSLFTETSTAIKRDGAKGDFLVSIANKRSEFLINIFNRNAKAHVKELSNRTFILSDRGDIIQDLRRSDHAIFWDYDIPAIYLGDGANTRNPYYHTKEDTKDKINYRQVEFTAKALVCAVSEVCTLTGRKN